MAVIEAQGLRKSYAGGEALRASTLRSSAGRWSPCWARTVPARPRPWRSWRATGSAPAARSACSGSIPGRAGRRSRERIGIVLQACGFDQEATVEELVGLHASYYPAARPVAEAIDLVGLAAKRTARIRTLSGGQLRWLDLALGIVGRPEVLFLDEPTTGFDPQARRHAWQLVRRLREQGTAILLTTHYLEEAHQLADRVAVLAAGRIVAEGPPGSLTPEPTSTVAFRLPNGVAAGDLPGDLPGGLEADLELRGDAVVLRTERPTELLAVLAGWARARGQELPELTVSRPTLEDAYLALIGGKEDPDA